MTPSFVFSKEWCRKKKYELGFIDSKFDFYEYGTYTKESENPTVQSKTLEELDDTYGVQFDCEGFFLHIRR